MNRCTSKHLSSRFVEGRGATRVVVSEVVGGALSKSVVGNVIALGL